VKAKLSALNERSVVIDTESSATWVPFTLSENQLSAQTSAVNVSACAVLAKVAISAAQVVSFIFIAAVPSEGADWVSLQLI
jgi:hypothetical protein